MKVKVKVEVNIKVKKTRIRLLEFFLLLKWILIFVVIYPNEFWNIKTVFFGFFNESFFSGFVYGLSSWENPHVFCRITINQSILIIFVNIYYVISTIKWPKERNFESSFRFRAYKFGFSFSRIPFFFYLVVALVQHFDASIWIDGILRCSIV